ncbi:hypothetical protein ACFPIJ_33440 [Dactylosporangium cerinum]|uniref:Butirosin biosynthesis protein H N-terminal domain-containing protein n=1 Tax=Dactylosporangium cerinum TaxID=1434730 RepID=A0ABV9W2V6_9ACTN
MTTTGQHLSCYTASLVGYLQRHQPAAADRLAAAVRLGVRTDLPGGARSFSHHPRIDRHDDWQLGYLAAARPGDAADGVRAELAASGAVIVVANTHRLPWSPSYQRSATPHWLLVTEASGARYRVEDPFDALLPHGTQVPYSGWVDEADLVDLMRLPTTLAAHLARRDRLALGTAVEVPAGPWRWLRREAADSPQPLDGSPDAGEWCLDTASALRWLAADAASDTGGFAGGAALDDCVEDLWAAARHHVLRADWLRRRALVPAGQAETVAAMWADLPRALRFAADSAGRGRPRPGMVRTSLDRLADAVDTLDSSALRRNHV